MLLNVTILTSSEAYLLKEVDDGVLLELLPPRPRVGVDVVAQAAAVEVICKREGRVMETGRYLLSVAAPHLMAR